ncbi:amidase [Natronococcus pandeyae]|uniref:Amidase n=1 Tax=Natronococcus pandeyae TaxID=2055836 RepID=A0A8J8TT84_9EURY|nr:amidase [Natronococcus pandeyae]
MPDEVLVEPVDELGRRLRDGEFTVRELTEAYLDRLERVGPELNAVVTVTDERALAAADRLDEELEAGEDRGPLHGIPYGVKDLVATEDAPTTWGAEPYRDQEFDEDAAVVRRLDEAGGVLLGKLAMVELAGGFGYDSADATFSGPGRNPWDVEAWAGGSSSGSASAVAAGLVGFAIGTETWGSLNTPAAFSGISAVRPTYDLVSRDGVMALSWTMDKVGPMCRTVGGCRRVLEAIAEPRPADRPGRGPPKGKPGAPRADGRKNGFTIAVPEDAGEGEQEGVRENFERSLETLSEFATLERVSLPDLPYAAMAGTIIDAEAAAAFETLIESGEVHELDDEIHQLGSYRASTVLAKDYVNANRVRTKAQRRLDELLTEYDALVSPARNSVANPIEESLAEFFGQFETPPVNAAANVTGLPGVTIPNGFGERDLPTAVEFVGRAWEEPTVLALACEYERRTEHVDHAALVEGLEERTMHADD